MKKIVAATLGLALSVSAMAQSTKTNTSTASTKSTYQKLKESPFGLWLALSNSGVRDVNNDQLATGEFTGVSGSLDAGLSYKLSQNWDALFMPEVSFENGEGGTVLDLDFLMYRLRRRNILTQKEHGLSLSADLRYYSFNGEGDSDNSSGRIRANVTLSKSWSDDFSTTVILRHDRLQNKNDLATTNSFSRFYFIPSYSINDTLTASVTTIYNSTNRNTNNAKYTEPLAQTDQWILISPELSISINPSFSIGLGGYWMVATRSYDSKTETKQWDNTEKIGDNMTYTANLNFNVF